MTDTSNKTRQSCTVSDTPETDAVLNQFKHHLPNWLASEIMAAVARKLERERDEAVNACHIWQRGHSKLVADRDDWKRLAVEQEKQIAKQLTILQEHGLAEYGN
jgi:hypothetical protein